MNLPEALSAFARLELKDASRKLLAELGYTSDKYLPGLASTPEAFEEAFTKGSSFDKAKALFSEWKSADLISQYTEDELSEQKELLSNREVSKSLFKSYVFISLELKQETYARGAFSAIARQVNRVFPMPVMVLFKHGNKLTIAVINRRRNKLDEGKDVLEKATLIRDINTIQPHRGHVDILTSLALPNLKHPQKKPISDFDALHSAWEQILNVELLNQRFYRDLSNWYFWALKQVEFPADLEEEEEKRKATGLIRLLTRLIFCWFLKEKDLVPNTLFNQSDLSKLLKEFDPESEKSSTYYQAILQNLFFATLNQRMGKDGNGKTYRGFAADEGFLKNRQTYDVNNLYRYEELFAVSQEEILKAFEDIPFLNGGLFECLDRADESTGKKKYIDGFSRNSKKRPHVPNRLFFDSGETADLSGAYGDTKRKAERVEGLVNILQRYKFTIVENTPIEQEIALDPELLGKVFENLLASYNEETKTTARKQTGSFYTPRPIVDYMVDESLKSHLKGALTKEGMQPGDAEAGLDLLFTYTEKNHAFSPEEVKALIGAIDSTKVLDPACGSGAFPMGALHKLVYILSKLDPNNDRWKQAQLAKIDSAPMREELERAFSENNDDYGRKLYLIESCLYGVDIQPIAIQITKLRFFISLICDQKTNRSKKDNHGIRPLPNLETKFVAADTLIGLPIPDKDLFIQSIIAPIEKEIEDAYHGHFTIQRRDHKLTLQRKIKSLRLKLAETLAGTLGAVSSDKAKHLAAWNPFDPQSTADFFDPHWMFGRALKDGFDIVIGNPPYVQIQKFPVTQKAKWEAQKFLTYAASADIYCLFFERAAHFLPPGGRLCYITSNKWMRAGYGTKLRSFLADETTLLRIVDFGELPVFAAATDTAITLASKEKASEQHAVQTVVVKEANEINDLASVVSGRITTRAQSTLQSDGWVLEASSVLTLLKKLRSAGRPLGEFVNGRFYRGILTGLNEAFIVNRATRDELIAKHPSSEKILKRFVHGSDAKKWGADLRDDWLIFARRGIEIKKYPAIYDHLLAFKKRLMPGGADGRKPGNYEWYEIQDNIAYWQEFNEPKIVFNETSKELHAFLDEDGLYTNKTLFMLITPQAKPLLAVLLSRTLDWLFRHEFPSWGDPWKGGRVQFRGDRMADIPIPHFPPAVEQSLTRLVDLITEAKTYNGSADVSPLEHEIDQHVYSLYGLTSEEIALIENAKQSD